MAEWEMALNTYKIQKKNSKGNGLSCKHCGAPVTSEWCPFCGNKTGLDTASTPMDYPEIECKEASIDFWSVAFPLIFAVGFTYAGLVMPVAFFEEIKETPHIFVAFVPFAVVGIVASFIVLNRLWAFLGVFFMGKDIEGTVYGYMDDTVAYNGRNGQVCKILLNTSHGPRFIMYQLASTQQPYRVNSKVSLKVYKDKFKIVNKKSYDAYE